MVTTVVIRPAFRFGTVAVLCGGFACGGDANGLPDTASDAGHDAGRRAWVDAGPRVRPDAGRDAARDARDAGPPEEARWVPLPGLPDGCVIERAENPAVLFEPVWESCGVGCECLNAGADPTVPGWHDGTRGWFTLIASSSAGHRIVAVASTEGPPVAAWRGPDVRDPGLCIVGPTAVGDGAAAFGIQSWPEGGTSEWRLYHAPLDTIGTVTEPAAVLTLRGVQRLAVSSTTVAAEVQPAGLVLAFEGGAQRTLGGLGTATPRIPQRVQVVGRTVWWEGWSTPIALVSGNITDGSSYFFRINPDDIFGMQVDGRDMAWAQGYGWDGVWYERVEFWTAPYTDDRTAFAPRKLLDTSLWSTQGRMGGGVYAFRRTDATPRLELYDLSDGRRRTLRLADVPLLHNPLYITADELLGVGRLERRCSLFRVQLDSIPYD